MFIVECDEKEAVEFQNVADRAFEMLGLKGEGIVEVAIVGEDEIRSLNAEAREVDKVTDVLSFPMLETIDVLDEKHYPYSYDEDARAVRIGSIVICRAVAERQGEEYGHGTRRELAFLFLHGLLHLLGYDHMTAEEEQKMSSTAEAVLTSLNITRNV